MTIITRSIRALPALGLAVFLAVALSACGTLGGAGSGLFNDQDQAGLTVWDVEFHDDGSLAAVEVVDGKEKQDVTLEADIKAGTIKYSATGVAAFPAFESRADVEKWVASRWPEIAPEVRGSIAEIVGFLAGL